MSQHVQPPGANEGARDMMQHHNRSQERLEIVDIIQATFRWGSWFGFLFSVEVHWECDSSGFVGQ